jgi:hypothetical protein
MHAPAAVLAVAGGLSAKGAAGRSAGLCRGWAVVGAGVVAPVPRGGQQLYQWNWWHICRIKAPGWPHPLARSNETAQAMQHHDHLNVPAAVLTVASGLSAKSAAGCSRDWAVVGAGIVAPDGQEAHGQVRQKTVAHTLNLCAVCP